MLSVGAWLRLRDGKGFFDNHNAQIIWGFLSVGVSAINMFLLNIVVAIIQQMEACYATPVFCVFRIFFSRCYRYCWRLNCWLVKASVRLTSLLFCPTLPLSRFSLHINSKWSLCLKFARTVITVVSSVDDEAKCARMRIIMMVTALGWICVPRQNCHTRHFRGVESAVEFYTR